ncbi:hypothetical protein [Bifidobacterium panos]|uniref:Uncharacterized protein n=1 Tax=Bifidobacterium panos TaxID=2675321 RepID=A0ABX1SY08_9BIFI|nr:hypothetical protein [Bifidobacterium sp. DSM 109963]NMN02720.1 hypothetical protein [Bifidobacterium sp. DSM 109963]
MKVRVERDGECRDLHVEAEDDAEAVMLKAILGGLSGMVCRDDDGEESE